MRPVDVRISGGIVLILPPGTAPPGAGVRTDSLTRATLLERLEHDRGGLGGLRARWTRLGLPLDAHGASDHQLVQAIRQDRRLLLLWMPDGRVTARTMSSDVPRVGHAGPVSTWSKGEKIAAALRRSVSGNNVTTEIRDAIEELLSPLNIAITIAMILALAAANAAGVGVIADAVLVGLAYLAAGIAGISAIWQFARATVEVMGAQNEAQIDHCAAEYTHALRILGTAFLTRFLIKVKASSKGAASKLEGEAAAKPMPKKPAATGTPKPAPKPAARAAAADPAAASAVNRPVYRMDGRDPGTIFKDGFQPKGTATDLKTYVDTNNPSAFVSTSKTADIAKNPAFATPGKYLYEIDGTKIKGIDVNAAYPANPFAHEQEIAVLGGVPRDAIISAKPVLPSGGLGNAIPNPFYKGGH